MTSQPCSRRTSATRCFLSNGQYSSMKPPPPAPVILPPIAPSVRARAYSSSSSGVEIFSDIRFFCCHSSWSSSPKVSSRPRSRAFFISTVSRLISQEGRSRVAVVTAIAGHLVLDDRGRLRTLPVSQSSRLYSSSLMIVGLSLRLLTMTRSSRNSMKLKPPNAAAYWSCSPPGMPRSTRSISYASSATS